MNKRYKNVNLPVELVEEIDKYIEENPQKGYSSRAEVTKEALRKFLREEKFWETTTKEKHKPKQKPNK